ncbi:MAG: 1-acyl-sn-glycerol-3-phosphate acyltransferase [Alistipes sp.]|nr:1-acyl-sn-glycerol-3-phosphate acyltransferase [Alistipes sp.]
MKILYSIVLYLVAFVLCTLFLLLSAVAFVVCYPFDKRRTVVHLCSRILVRSFMVLPPCWSHRVVGWEKVDPKKPYVIVMNHNTLFDIVVLYFLRLEYRWVSKIEVVKAPYFGQFLFLHGDILINRGRATQALEQLREEGKMWLERGVSIAIFPEGTRSKTGQMGRFNPGAFDLAKRNEVEVLPIVLHGTRTVMRPKSWQWSWRNRVTLEILDPISVERLQNEPLRELADATREEMVAIYERLEAQR